MLKEQVSFQHLEEGDQDAVHQLIESVWREFIAADYTAEGVEEFRKYIVPEAIVERYKKGVSFAFLAVHDGEIIGYIEVRDGSHIMLFFVRRDYQQRGLGGELFSLALERCLEIDPELSSITVNSSPYAIPVYERLGFTMAQPEQIVNGIRHTPMIYRIIGAGR